MEGIGTRRVILTVFVNSSADQDNPINPVPVKCCVMLYFK